MSAIAHPTRRDVLRVMSIGGAGLMLGCFPIDAKAKESSAAGEAALEPSVLLRVDPNGDVTVTATRSDMGQGVRTTLAMMVAEELDADWSKVKVVNATGNATKYGRQGTGGSGTVRSTWREFRTAGAGARAMLVAAAAQKLGVDASTLRTENGKVIHDASKQSATYGELATIAAKLPAPVQNPTLKERSQYRIMGKSKPSVDAKDFSTGKAVFAQDVKVDGMAYAVISRKPSFGAQLESFDDTAARKVSGVIDVFRVSTGVAVVGRNTWAAMQGAEALKMNWRKNAETAYDTNAIKDQLTKAKIEHMPMTGATKTVDADYHFPYMAHSTMETMNAVADVKADSCTVWAGLQSPDGCHRQLCQSLGLPEDKVTVNLTLLGGGFGRRFSHEFVSEAVEISKLAKRPIKLVWTKTQCLANDNYRSQSLQSLRGGLDANGAVVGVSHQYIQAGGRGGTGQYGRMPWSYSAPNSGLSEAAVPIRIPTSAWRSVEHSQIDVANECFIDELAHAAGKDPVEFRMGIIRNDRLKAVLQTAAEKGDWGKPLAKGRGRGVAVFAGYGSYCAHVIEIEIVDNKPIVRRVTAAVDCGFAINPTGVKAQIEGACHDGISTALHAHITVKDGTVEQTNWHEFEWVRQDGSPKIDVHIIDGGGDPGGMGEVGYPGVPAAVANAIFSATGKRLRNFPLSLTDKA